MSEGAKVGSGPSGPRKAAILMITLEPEAASRLMAELDKAGQERVALEIVRLEQNPPTAEERERILREFYRISVVPLIADRGGPGAALKLLETIHPAEEAKKMVEGAETALGRRHFQFLRSVEPESLAALVAEEHPQLIALVLSYLPADRSARVILALPPGRQQEVIRRLAALEPAAVAVVEQIEEALRGRVASVAPASPESIHGVSTAASVLTRVPPSTERSILEGLRAEQPELADRIRKLMFTFSDLARVDDRGLQNLLRGVELSKVALALKVAGPELEEKFFRNMSPRAAERVREEMEHLGPVRASDVEEAQVGIVEEALRLEESGEAVIEGRGGGGRGVA